MSKVCGEQHDAALDDAVLRIIDQLQQNDATKSNHCIAYFLFCLTYPPCVSDTAASTFDLTTKVIEDDWI